MMEKQFELYQLGHLILEDALEEIMVELYLKQKEQKKKSFLITGCGSEVGTTTVAINLAITIAKTGGKTILIDADMRKLSDYKRVNENVDINMGLKEYLNNMAELKDIIYKTNCSNLYYLPSGKQNNKAVGLLCSEKMDELLEKLIKEFDYIIFDTTSINTVVDAKILASKVDEILLVAAQNQTKKKQIHMAKEKIDEIGKNIGGIIFNKVDKREYRKYRENYNYFREKRYKSRKEVIK